VKFHNTENKIFLSRFTLNYTTLIYENLPVDTTTTL